MKFRAKIFLAIILPSSALVAAAVSAAISEITRTSEDAAQDELRRTRRAFEGVLREQFNQLVKLRKPFEGSRFDAAISAAVSSGDRVNIKDEMEYQFQLIGGAPDFFELRMKGGGLLLRQSFSHVCTPDCVHPRQAWIADREKALTEFDDLPYLAIAYEHEKGTLVFGRNLKPYLDQISKDFLVGIVLEGNDKVVYSSPLVAGWNVALGREGAVFVQGKRYLCSTGRPEESELSFLTMFRSMAEVDAKRRDALVYGVGGLTVAVLVALLVSVIVSRGVSRPVEQLVDAARQIAQGDYKVKVQIGTRDEIGRLGGAFNEMTEGLRKRQEIMDKTLSRDVAEEFLKGTDRPAERRVVTIVFMDIRGYTSGTEGMDPAEVVVMLNELMDLLSGAIVRHGGIVNKFLGDGLMAMFGAPKPLEGHALKAVLAGLEMQKWMARWNDRRIARGLPAFFSGIGINTGEAMCGKVGAQDRMEYTLIGEEVNLASRICGKAAPRQVLVTKQTWELVKAEVKGKELEPVQVKGLSYPIKVYEVLE